MKKSFILFLLFSLFILNACQTSTQIQWNPISKVQTDKGSDVCLQNKFKDRRNEGTETQVGTNTWTLVAIPIAPIYANSEVNKKVRDALEEAMEGADIRVEVTDSVKSCNRTITGQIQEFWFTSYNWFWPFCKEKGSIEVELMLLNQTSNRIWQKKYFAKVSKFTFGGAYGYGGMIKKAMNKILKDIQQDLNSNQFKTLIQS